MSVVRPRCGGMALVLAALAMAAMPAVRATPVRAAAQADSLVLYEPPDVRVWRVYKPVDRSFIVYISWRNIPDSLASYVHPPDTTGWAAGTTPSELSVPQTRGPYTGDIDRTIAFRVTNTGATAHGVVGQGTVVVDYFIRREENITGSIDVGAAYTPGSWALLTFRNQDTGARLDYGVQVRFPAGKIDQNGVFAVGAETFEGFHIWRGIKKDGSDLEVIGEISREEAFIGSATGGSYADSLYFNSIIPTLRDSLTWFSPIGSIDCLGSRINIPLEDDQFLWYDCNAFNGYTYYYAVTTFDRGYSEKSGRQGLEKVDSCQPFRGQPFTCGTLVPLKVEVDPQNNVKEIYAVPNPYRSGGSQLTHADYRNFPDNKVRFVNVPAQAQLKIYTLAGDLVWETTNDGGGGTVGGNIEWDVKNESGNDVASGVYIFKVEATNGDVVYGRLVVIR